MAGTSYGVNHPLAVKVWSKKLFQEALKKTYFDRFMGKSDSSLIQIKDDLTKSAGDRITVGLRMQLTGDGVQGDGTLEGNEEALVTYSDNIFIDQLRHAVRSAGKMSEQRVPFSVRDEARTGLEDWWSGRLDTCFFNQLAGFTPATDTRYTGNQAVVTSTNLIRAGSQSTDQALTSSNLFTLDLIDKAKEQAQTMSPLIRPLKVNGEEKFVMFLHPYQVTDMRLNTASGQWADIQKAAITGGQIDNNPIYTGALGEYNGVILQSAFRIPQGVNSSTGAAISTVRRASGCHGLRRRERQ
jgi:N4-gp56 family major capsid protein